MLGFFVSFCLCHLLAPFCFLNRWYLKSSKPTSHLTGDNRGNHGFQMNYPLTLIAPVWYRRH